MWSIPSFFSAGIVADAAAIAALEMEVSPSPWSEAQVAGSLHLATTTAWIDEDPEVVGYLLVSTQASEGEVLILGVSPRRRRQGRGRRLLAAARAHWQGRANEAFLEVRADNAGAIALYEACGWQVVARRPRYYRDGIDADRNRVGR